MDQSSEEELGKAEGQTKKKKFKPFRAVRRLFSNRRKNKSREEEEPPSPVKAASSTGELIEDGKDTEAGQLNSNLSMSADSIFSMEQQKVQKPRMRPGQSFGNMALTAELKGKLVGRKIDADDDEDEDAGLPASPPTHSTTADVLMEESLKQGRSGGSEKSLLSMDSSENEMDTPEMDPLQRGWSYGISPTSDLDTKPSKMKSKKKKGKDGDLDLDAVQSTSPLSSDIAKSRMNVRPKARHSAALPSRKRNQSPSSPTVKPKLAQVTEESANGSAQGSPNLGDRSGVDTSGDDEPKVRKVKDVDSGQESAGALSSDSKEDLDTVGVTQITAKQTSVQQKSTSSTKSSAGASGVVKYRESQTKGIDKSKRQTVAMGKGISEAADKGKNRQATGSTHEEKPDKLKDSSKGGETEFSQMFNKFARKSSRKLIEQEKGTVNLDPEGSKEKDQSKKVDKLDKNEKEKAKKVDKKDNIDKSKNSVPLVKSSSEKSAKLSESKVQHSGSDVKQKDAGTVVKDEKKVSLVVNKETEKVGATVEKKDSFRREGRGSTDDKPYTPDQVRKASELARKVNEQKETGRLHHRASVQSIDVKVEHKSIRPVESIDVRVDPKGKPLAKRASFTKEKDKTPVSASPKDPPANDKGNGSKTPVESSVSTKSTNIPAQPKESPKLKERSLSDTTPENDLKEVKEVSKLKEESSEGRKTNLRRSHTEVVRGSGSPMLAKTGASDLVKSSASGKPEPRKIFQRTMEDGTVPPWFALSKKSKDTPEVKGASPAKPNEVKGHRQSFKAEKEAAPANSSENVQKVSLASSKFAKSSVGSSAKPMSPAGEKTVTESVKKVSEPVKKVPEAEKKVQEPVKKPAEKEPAKETDAKQKVSSDEKAQSTTDKSKPQDDAVVLRDKSANCGSSAATKRQSKVMSLIKNFQDLQQVS